MKYAMLIYEPQLNFDARRERALDEEFWEPWRAYHKALVDAGVYAGGNPLDPPDTTATTIRVRGGERHVQDGPYADTKEQLGGFILFELPSLDEAIAWASKCPAAHYGTVEVRPVADLTHIFGPEHGRGT
jgi:hypothetical protein